MQRALALNSEVCLEWLQMALELFPIINALTVNRLPHLLRTRGANAPFCLVELEAAWLHIEITKLHNSLYLWFDIVNDFFVVDSQYLARENLFPVVH